VKLPSSLLIARWPLIPTNETVYGNLCQIWNIGSQINDALSLPIRAKMDLFSAYARRPTSAVMKFSLSSMLAVAIFPSPNSEIIVWSVANGLDRHHVRQNIAYVVNNILFFPHDILCRAQYCFFCLSEGSVEVLCVVI